MRRPCRLGGAQGLLQPEIIPERLVGGYRIARRERFDPGMHGLDAEDRRQAEAEDHEGERREGLSNWHEGPLDRVG
ncbi:MAG: hypothetical protein NVS9B1_15950 [Candidatus Dormibacteraceae bacterium]